MITKHEYRVNNEELIKKELEETLEFIIPKLTETGYFYSSLISFQAPVTAGIVIAVAELLEEHLSELGWTVYIEFQRGNDAFGITVK